MYGKHFQSMYTGSMFGAGAHIFAVWGYVISHTRDGTCELNPSYLASVLGMNISEVLVAIDFLCQPDPRSRSKEQDGRRLIREGEYQYIVPQAEKYRKIRSRDDQRESNRERQRKFRESHRITREITTVTKNNDISEADPDPESDKNKIMGQQTGPDASAGIKKNRESKEPIPVHQGTPEDAGFARLRSLYPKREGSQRWGDAAKHYRARLKEGISRETIEDGVMRYAKYCVVKGIEGTSMVQQAATFLGINRDFENDWKCAKTEERSPFA